MELIAAIPLIIAAYVLGSRAGHEKGYKQGFIEGSEKGIKNVTRCIERTLKLAGYKDKWISGLFTAMSKNINPLD